MKKILLCLLTFLSILSPIHSIVHAEINEVELGYKILAEPSNDIEKTFIVKDFRVIDGDTVDLILDRKQEPSIKARILLMDTPEKGEPYFNEAKERLNTLLTKADVIKVEYEGKEKDHYKRDLVHVWVDDILVQEIMVTEGYAIARYIQDYIPDSKYADTIYQSQDYAERNGLGVWASGNPEYLAKAERQGGAPQQAQPAQQTQETASEPTQSPAVGEYVDENGNGLIKGSNNGIYHVPGSTYYDRTTNPAAWFKTVEEAENAGYRAPKR